MIVSCPSCETRYDLPSQRFAAGGAMINCAQCGHAWMEAPVIDVQATAARQVPTVIEHGFEPDHEVRRLVEAAREAQDAFAAKRRARRNRLAAWGVFAAAVTTPLIAAAAFPEEMVRFAPASIRAYQAMGREVNIYGLELRHLEMQNLLVDGARVLAVKGDIVNVSGAERKIPSLRFALHNGANAEVYRWTVDSGARPLRPGESTNFVTRVAAPPEAAKNLEIRFARADEIGSDAGHE